MTNKQMQQFKGFTTGYMPIQIKAKLKLLFLETGYLLKAEDRNGPWLKVDTIFNTSNERLWHDEMEKSKEIE